MTRNRTNPGGLPYGCGSLQKRGLMWWAIYCYTDGQKIQESSKTTDLDEARRFLAARALVTVQARAARLREVIDGTERKTAKRAQRPNRSYQTVGSAARQRARGGSVQPDSKGRAGGNRKKGARA